MSDEVEREDQQADSQNPDQYVNEQLIEAETALEKAICASEDPFQRDALLANYRAVVTTLMRYYDDHE